LNKVLQIIVIAIFTSACTQTVEVKSAFPEPVIEPLPMTVGVRYSDELKQFAHVEDPIADSEWTIRLGAANLSMLQTVFTGMFATTLELDASAAGESAPGVDLIIEPNLDELEFALPEQMASDQYTVWLRYKLRLLAPDGKRIGDWRITGYGQEDQGAMGMGSETAMEEATVIALRDAAANIITGFESAPGIADYLPKPDDAE
jgi:hypothetical protein